MTQINRLISVSRENLIRPQTATGRRYSWIWFLLAALLLPVSSVAQSQLELDPNLIQARIENLQANDVTDTDETLTTYLAVLSLLDQAASFESEAATYIAALTDAPLEKAEITARTEAAAENLTPDAADLENLTKEELESEFGSLRIELSDLTSLRDSVDRQLADREINARWIRDRLEAISTRLEELPGTSFATVPEAKPTLSEAQRWRDIAERQALTAERRAQEARLASQAVRYSTLRARQTELVQEIDALSKRVKHTEEALRRRLSTIVPPEALGLDGNDPVYGLAVHLADQIALLSVERERVAAQSRDILSQRDDLNLKIRALTERYDTARRVVEFAGESDVLGSVLIVYWYELDQYRIADLSRGVSKTIGDTVINRIRHEEALASLSRYNSLRTATDLMNEANVDPALVGETALAALRDLIRTTRDQLSMLIADESSLIEQLGNLDKDYQRLHTLLDDFESFLEGWILWVESHMPLFEVDFAQFPAEMNAIVETVRSMRLARIDWSALLLLMLAGALAAGHRQISQRQHQINSLIGQPEGDSILHTLRALALTSLRALPLPLLLLALSRQLSGTGTIEGDFLVDTLGDFAVLVFFLQLLQLTCQANGLGPVHFAWPAKRCETTALEARWFLRYSLPLLGLTAAFMAFERESIDAIPERLVVLAALLAVLHRLTFKFRRTRAVNGTSNQVARRIQAALMTALLVMVLCVVAGYFRTVMFGIQLAMELLWVAVILVLAYALLSRWLNITKLHLGRHELISSSNNSPDLENSFSVEEEQAALEDLQTTTVELLRAGILTVGLLLLMYLWSDLLPVFEGLGTITLWTRAEMIDGESVVVSMTLRKLLLFFFLVVATLYATRKIPALLELVLRSLTSITPGGRYATTTLANYAIAGTGTVMALAVLGVNWAQLQWLVAALGVGIGFGLQEIVANFISGLIILFERPIRVGDVVTVGDKDGVVTRIRIRATTIKDWDGKELLVPNKEFITQRLLNWSLTDPISRLAVTVGIAYGSDVDRAMQILRDVAVDHDKVLDDPEPSVVFTLFGDNSLQLILRCHVNDLRDRMPVITDLHREINKRFNEAGIVIAFPQRDMHLDDNRPIRITIDDKPSDPA